MALPAGAGGCSGTGPRGEQRPARGFAAGLAAAAPPAMGAAQEPQAGCAAADGAEPGAAAVAGRQPRGPLAAHGAAGGEVRHDLRLDGVGGAAAAYGAVDRRLPGARAAPAAGAQRAWPASGGLRPQLIYFLPARRRWCKSRRRRRRDTTRCRLAPAARRGSRRGRRRGAPHPPGPRPAAVPEAPLPAARA